MLWAFLLSYQYNTLLILLKKMPPKIQPIMALILPTFSELSGLVLNKLIFSCGYCEPLEMKSHANIINNVNYLLYVAVTISTYATEMTKYCILMEDVLKNFYHCYKIMKLHRKISLDQLQMEENKSKKETEIQILTLIETAEMLIPIAYTVTFLVAYQGPNADILGSIKNNYWSSHKVDNIGKVVTTGILMFSIDFASLLIRIIVLWVFCKINILKEFCRTLKIYWPLIAVNTGALICKVRRYNVNSYYVVLNYKMQGFSCTFGY